MRKNLAAFAALVIVFLVAVSSVALIKPSGPKSYVSGSDKPFYVGVTYCGDSVTEAKQLIDEVKSYTNLFVLQSGSLMNDLNATQQIGDYAVKSGLNVMLYYGVIDYIDQKCYQLVDLAQANWGSHFLGLYFNDEPGGKILDKTGAHIGQYIYRNPDGSISISSVGNLDNSDNATKSSFMTFDASGEVDVIQQTSYPFLISTGFGIRGLIQNQSQSHIAVDSNKLVDTTKNVDYYPNGTISCITTNTYGENTESRTETIGPFFYQPDASVQDQNGQRVTDQGNISQFQSYQEIQALNPFGTRVRAMDTFERSVQSVLGEVRDNVDTPLFTSDYALYWYDYQSGYDTVFAQFVGNESRDRHIALCRGAAETFGKDWGAIITWKYNQSPYLESGDELYNDLALAYNAGAKYGIVFTYPNITAYGTLTDEHFAALQRFWNTIHTNPDSLGRTQSDAAYVVPADYGFGFRSANDTIWGQFPADALSSKIYSDTVALTAKYGARLNILYDGPETAVALGNYSSVYYYNQTIA